MFSRKQIAAVIAAVLVCLAIPAFAGTVYAEEAGQMYTLDAQPVNLESMPGVYSVQARLGDSIDGKNTIGIPSVAKQTLADMPTKEMPAIIMGAAVNYEKKTGPTSYEVIPGAALMAPYSYFRWSVIQEERQEEDGTISVHEKLSGFDGTYYIIRVDVSKIIEGMGEDQYLHVKQESNKALMPAIGMDGSTYANGLGAKAGSYSLASGAAALKDTGAVDVDRDTPYLDVIVMSSGKLAAGADAGKKKAPSADIKLKFYVDDKEKYNDLQVLDPNNMPKFPYTVKDPIAGKMVFKNEKEYTAALMDKFYKGAKATAKNRATSYLVKGSDLEIDSAIDESEELTREGKPAGINWMEEANDFWSMEKAIIHPEYDDHTIRMICEVPVLDGMYIGSGDKERSVVLDVNSFDIQIANNTKQDKPGLTIDDGAVLRIMDGTGTAGAELAVGNNATLLIKEGGVLVIDESCTSEVEYDAGTVVGAKKNPNKNLLNGEITIERGGTITNFGVLNIEGKENKPLDPNNKKKPVATDQKTSDIVVQYGGYLNNFGCISLKGALYNMGLLENYGKYNEIIKAGDPDKGFVDYHKGIQVTWKDDVTRKGSEPGVLNIGIDPKRRVNPEGTAVLNNYGDIVFCPGTCNLYGEFNNSRAGEDVGQVYLCTAEEAIIPITPKKENPLVVEKRVALNPPRESEFNNDGVINNDGAFYNAKVELIHNGVLGALTVIGDPIDPPEVSATAPGTEHVIQGSTVRVIVDANRQAAGTAAFVKAKNAKSVTVPANVKINGKTFRIVGIGEGAFSDAKAGTIVVKTKALTKESVRGSLKGSKVKRVKVKVGSKKINKKYVKKYRKIFTKKNAGRKVKVS